MSKTFFGPAGIDAFRATRIKEMLWVCAHTGETRPGVTPSSLLETAAEITGQKFSPGEYLKAVDAIDARLSGNQGTAGIASSSPSSGESTKKEERIAELRAELQELTGKKIEFRNRDAYNAGQLRMQRARRERLRRLEAEAATRHPADCTCTECYERAKAVQRAVESQARA